MTSDASSQYGSRFTYPIGVREFDAYEALSDTQSVARHTFSSGSKVLIVIPYTESNGLVSGGNGQPAVLVKTLSVYWYNPVSRTYEKQTTEIDTVNRVLKARVEHFSTFVVMGSANLDVDSAYAYPVPYRPAKNLISSTGGGITFNNLPNECTVKVYTINGEIVKTIRDAFNNKDWDVKNDDGDEIASGVYIYVIETNQGKKKISKIVVIR
jgi:hypothetical protein